jgi:hypothetical protein
MGKARAGFERILYYDGTPGSTAATIVDHVVDVDVNKGGDTFDTTDRGDSASIPIVTAQRVSRTCELTFSARYYDSDAKMAALIAAAEAGSDVALKVVRYSGGLTEVDADFSLTYASAGKLADGQLIEFTATLSRDSGRTPVIVSA